MEGISYDFVNFTTSSLFHHLSPDFTHQNQSAAQCSPLLLRPDPDSPGSYIPSSCIPFGLERSTLKISIALRIQMPTRIVIHIPVLHQYNNQSYFILWHYLIQKCWMLFVSIGFTVRDNLFNLVGLTVTNVEQLNYFFPPISRCPSVICLSNIRPAI